jgi:hypothetical protein
MHYLHNVCNFVNDKVTTKFSDDELGKHSGAITN